MQPIAWRSGGLRHQRGVPLGELMIERHASEVRAHHGNANRLCG
jgi:hypothetical protein